MRPPRRRLVFAALAAVGIALAAVGVSQWGTWAATSALAEPLAREARAGLEAAAPALTSADADALEKWLEPQVGFRVEIPAIARASLMGGRVAVLDGARGVVLVYDLDGTRLTYFALPTRDAWSRGLTSEAVTPVSRNGYELAMWTERGATRALVAPMQRVAVLEVAEDCRRQSALREN